MTMQRQKLVNEFLSKAERDFLKFCKAKYCACNGCINKLRYANDFRKMYPDEAPITEMELNDFKIQNNITHPPVSTVTSL